MTHYKGSCHCGDVQFEISTIPTELTTCDCSLCKIKNAVMLKVPESDFELHSEWGMLSLYEWNTKVAKHYFCSRCGIYTFHRKRAEPDHFGINVFCLINFDIDTLPHRATDGATMSVVE